MRILVTGATGFVGSHLVRRLVTEGHAVRILRRDTSRLESLGDGRYEEVIGDIVDPVAVDRAVAGCEVVFHCAALIQYWAPRNAEQVAINVEGTRNVVAAGLRHGITRLIHVSSIAAVGYSPQEAPVDETTPYNLWPFRNNYCDSKYAAELVVREGVRQGLDAVIVNPGTIYGPGDRRRASYLKGLMGWFTARGGMAVVDVDDVVEGMIRVWRQGRRGERYLLIAENWTFAELGRAIAQRAGRHGPRVVLSSATILTFATLSAACQGLCNTLFPLFFKRLAKNGPTLTPAMARLANIRCFFSNAKARTELGMAFRPFTDTLDRTMAWYRQQQLL